MEKILLALFLLTIYSLPLLNNLFIAFNGLTGTISPSLVNLRALTQLSLNTNHFTGTIPSVLGQMTNLTNLHLETNNLIGTVSPELCNLNLVSILDLSYNQLSQTIPSCLFNDRVKNIYLEENLFTGHIPTALSDCTNSTAQLGDPALTNNTKYSLSFVDVSNNRLTGPLPAQAFTSSLISL
eukprot:gene30752-38011_t